MSTPETITTHTSGPRLNFKVNMFQVGTVWPVKFGKFESKITIYTTKEVQQTVPQGNWAEEYSVISTLWFTLQKFPKKMDI